MGSRRREKDTPRLAAGGVLAVALVVGVILLLGRGGGPPGEAEREHQEGPQHAVSEKKANPWGLFDVHGNVGEWCEDHWVHTYSGAPSDGSAWTEGRPRRSGSAAAGAGPAPRSGAAAPAA